MPNTYTELRRTVVGTATPSVTLNLSGISGYTDLVLVANFTVATASANLVMTFNGDTTSGLYSKTQMEGTGSVAVSGRTTSANNIGLDSNIGDDTTGPSIHIINLMNYANTSVFKTVLHRQSGFWSSNPGSGARAGLWRNTNAITSITLSNGAVNFTVGSTFSLYGIANADQGAAKATGGIITEDSQYWYHTFGASGTFVPKQSLTCDVLIVAGGGGGGANGGAVGPGGGGAGGLLGYASQSLSVASYAVTVGAGGVGGTAAYPTNGNNSVFNSNTATGGGYGQTVQAGGWRAAQNGGSGGGGGISTIGNGTTGQGRNGGGNYSGGGGGAFALGGDGNGTGSVGGNGGQGATFNSIVGTTTGPFSFINAMGAATNTGQLSSGNYYYAGGGGAWNGSGGLGGGAGTNGAGTANTGGGGGGCDGTGGTKGAGGSGVVVIRYAK